MDVISQLLEVIPEFAGRDLIDNDGGSFAMRTLEGILISPAQAGPELAWVLNGDDFVLFPGGGDASMAKAGRRPAPESLWLRTALDAGKKWAVACFLQPVGVMAFTYARQPLPVSPNHAGDLWPKQVEEVPIAGLEAKNSSQVATELGETMRAHFDNSDTGAVLVGQAGCVIASVSVDCMLRAAIIIEKAAEAQMWRLGR